MTPEALYGRLAHGSALFGLSALVLLPMHSASPALVGIPIFFVFLALAADAARALRTGDIAAGQSLFLWGTLLFVAGTLLTRPASYQGVQMAMIWLTVIAATLVLKRPCPARSPHQEKVLRAVFALLFLVCLRGLAERLYLFDVLRDAAAARGLTPRGLDIQGFLQSNRARATFGQANGLAGFLLLFLPLSLFCLHTSRRAMLLLALLVATLIATSSRGGALVALMTAGFLLRRYGRSFAGWQRPLGTVMLGTGLGGALVCGAVIAGFHLPVDSLDHAFDTLRLRGHYWMTALKMMSESPWGVGMGLFGEHYLLAAAEGAPFSRFAHNGFLHLLAECGLWAVAFFGLGWALLRRWKASLPGTDDTPPCGRSLPVEVLPALALGATTTGLDVVPEAPWIVTMSLLGAAAWAFDRLVGQPCARSLAARKEFRRAAVIWGGAAFLLHSLVDFDLHIGGVVAGLGLLFSILPAAPGPGGNRIICLASLVLGVTLAAGWFLGPQSLEMQRRNDPDPILLARWPVNLRLIQRYLPETQPLPAPWMSMLQKVEEDFGPLPSLERMVNRSR